MRIIYFVQQKLKLVALIALCMAVILITNLVSNYSLKSIDKSFNSIYSDRLIPARDLFHVYEAIHFKEELMNDFYAEEQAQNVGRLKKKLQAKNLLVDSLLKKYEKTYLVKEEKASLEKLKSKIKTYEDLELLILDMAEKNPRELSGKLYEQHGKKVLGETFAELEVLTDIQSQVGGELIQKSKAQVWNSKSMSNIQIIMVVLIGVFAQVLIMTSRIFTPRSDKVNLN